MEGGVFDDDEREARNKLRVLQHAEPDARRDDLLPV
jgi:hypothetical protein